MSENTVLKILKDMKSERASLISIYIPPRKQIFDFINVLRDEYGTAFNIKDPITRNRITKEIVVANKIITKNSKFIGKRGIAIFLGTNSDNEIETYTFLPLEEEIKVVLMRTDFTFHLNYLTKLVMWKKEVFS